MAMVPDSFQTDSCTITIDGSACLYQSGLEILRDIVEERGRTGYVRVAIEPKINGEELLIILNAHTMYIVGIQGANGVWYEFPDEKEKYVFPVSNAVKAKGTTSYQDLGMENVSRQKLQVNALITSLRNFDGNTSSPDVKRNLITLILLVSEAARFRSVEAAMCAYIRDGAVDLKVHYATVTTWSTQTKANSTDVIVRRLDDKATSSTKASSEGSKKFSKKK